MQKIDGIIGEILVAESHGGQVLLAGRNSAAPNVTGTAVTMPPTPHVEHYLVGSGGPPADATVTTELINSNECRGDRKRVGKCRVERVTFTGDAVFSYSNIPTLAHPHTHTHTHDSV